MVFIDLRDKSGLIQCVVLPQYEAAIEIAKMIRNEWVVSITGIVNKRPERNINPELPLGMIELEITSIAVLNEAETPYFDVMTDGKEIGEEHRLTYRYLDMRRDRIQKNLRNRHNATMFIRNFLQNEGFIEIETPLLTKSTPEGARDYVVPSRIHTGNFYALPQSPQQYALLS